MKQLSPTDTLFVNLETPRTPLHISSLQVYDPPAAGENPVRFKDVLQRYEQRLGRSSVFRRKLARVAFDLDSPYWIEDADFDLEFHVRHIALPKPGDWRQFCILIARLQSQSLDLSRPPWEAYVIEGLDNINGLPSGSWAMLSKTHHAAIDGSTGNQMAVALHDLEPYPVEIKVADTWKPESEPGQLKMLGKAYLNLFKTPKQIKTMAGQVIKSRSNKIRSRFDSTSHIHDLKERIRFNADVSPQRVFGGLRIELSQLKHIKNVVKDATLNDVLLSIVSGAMRHYLSEKNEMPDGPLTVMVPISTRTKEGVNADGGNEVAAMNVKMCIDIADPLERLKGIHSDAVASKAYADAVGADMMSSMIESIPAGLMSLGMRAAAKTGLMSKAPTPHTVVTNVPGPQFPLYFCGAKSSLAMGLGCLADGSGLFHTVASYNGYLSLTFLSCKEMMPDPDFYHQCINRSFKEHLEAADVLVNAKE
ncbi:Putative diacyglycerol O-acyltransferase [Zhongshania aliphaticivorans]|uniref:diacylglycerol O-acyltransferase n=1 Tax=Zhongshania aliphaticivorans TaxID=1470434 RepID=A0A5S9NSI5_9GAMM|nr:wax ester/triacylglycerol synthase family O-acyltransferase [Zhongshania aliphaticivorans]CAA0093519.1 Putative diacyglycerol O-acyltransferase [Zhongshania aliphaticivorans]CAA0111460.1 Putative diacyglycerol O-acyltransferase [Zhongshania aliphaticivorans]